MKHWEIEYEYFDTYTEVFYDEAEAMRRFYALCENPLSTNVKLYEVTEEE